MDKISFETDVPQVLAFKYDQGKLTAGHFGSQMFYSLADGRCWYADLSVAEQIKGLHIRKGEKIQVVKKSESGKTAWDVQRVDMPGELELTGPPTGMIGPALENTASAKPLPQSEHSANGNGAAHSNGHAVAPPPTRPALMTGQAQFVLQQLIAAIEITAAAENYSRLMGREIKFTSEDIRALAITCFIQQSRSQVL